MGQLRETKSVLAIVWSNWERPVECLGRLFENDADRRAYFLEKLREKLSDPAFRNSSGFPQGAIEDILRVSDPPYYTACPNPFIEDFIRYYGRSEGIETDDDWRPEPFAADVTEGKNDRIYNVHPYHTKVPYKAIMRYILHYTRPGDIVFDGFCGSGMTGVAAQMCGSREAVRSLGYEVLNDGTILDEEGKPFSRLGGRMVILNDLAPSATFIAYNYNRGVGAGTKHEEMRRFVTSLLDLERKYWSVTMPDGTTATIAYVVWSDVFFCSNCSGEIVFWDAAVDRDTGKVAPEISCSHCGAIYQKRSLIRSFLKFPDPLLGGVVEYPKLEPVLVGIAGNADRSVHEYPAEHFREQIADKLKLIDRLSVFPDYPLDTGWEMYRHGMGKHGVKSHKQLYIPLSALTLEEIWTQIWSVSDFEVRSKLIWVFTSIALRCSKFNRRLPSGGGGPITGVLYIPSLIRQENPIRLFARKLNELMDGIFNWLPRNDNGFCLQTTGLEGCSLPPDSIDYVFLDPPFGSNIFYADMNFIWESWLGLFTNRGSEAVISDRALTQRKTAGDYGELMYKSFTAVYRALKPGRWMTVEFHNSSNVVWNIIAESIQRAGFVIADVRTLDKKQKSFRQTTAAGAVKHDLVISAYKPATRIAADFRLKAGTEDGVWAFVRTHLRHLPVFVRSQDDKAEVVVERLSFRLFDRMVAFHVQRGVTVPLSAAEFYQGLAQRFPERDGMYFLPEQVAEYDKKRMTVKEVLQLQLFVTDESSAIQWLRQQLAKKPQTFQELHPQFLKEIGGWHKHEKPLELLELLEQNFLRYDGKGEVPSQIHSYLSTNFKELRNLPKDDLTLRAKAKDRWYVPDPNKAGDLEELRERALLREFEEYRESKQKRLKVFRLEAVRAGFKKAWQERDYATIIAVARKIPENVLQEDPKLLMWYDQALTRTGDDR